MWIWWGFLVVVLLWVFWSLFATAARRRESGSGSAEEILKKSYAKGEIDRETYEQKLHDLRA